MSLFINTLNACSQQTVNVNVNLIQTTSRIPHKKLRPFPSDPLSHQASGKKLNKAIAHIFSLSDDENLAKRPLDNFKNLKPYSFSDEEITHTRKTTDLVDLAPSLVKKANRINLDYDRSAQLLKSTSQKKSESQCFEPQPVPEFLSDSETELSP